MISFADAFQKILESVKKAEHAIVEKTLLIDKLTAELGAALARAEKAERCRCDAPCGLCRERRRQLEAERDAAIARAERAERSVD